MNTFGKSERGILGLLGLRRASVTRQITPRQVRAHAKRIFRFLFKTPYRGELFLCGGAFEPLLDPRLKISVLNLWVRDRRERERLVGELVGDGAGLLHDRAPQCIRLEKHGRTIEISNDDVHGQGVAEIVRGFDLACRAIGASYRHGEIQDVYFSDRANQTLGERTILFEDSYLRRMREQRSPALLCGIDRMEHIAEDIGYAIDEQSCTELWEVFDSVYSPEEKQRCLDTYLESVVSSNARCNAEVLRRASGMVLNS